MKNTDESNSREMPRYGSSKVVWALEIGKIEHKDSSGVKGSKGAVITPADEKYAPIDVSGAFCDTYTPKVGGYIVFEKNGNQSYCNAVRFKDEFFLTIPTEVEMELINAVEQLRINEMNVDSEEVLTENLNWFERQPLHIKLLLHFLTGLMLGLAFGFQIWR